MYNSFNTQPPEGGWAVTFETGCEVAGFNTQPPEGGWEKPPISLERTKEVSTHSRLKAAGILTK